MVFLLSEAAIISTCLQGLLQGIAVFMFALMTIITTRESRHRPMNRGMFAASSALILLSTLEFTLNIIRLVRGFITVGPHLPGGVEEFFPSLVEPSMLIKGILHSVQILILDGVVIFRAYVAWQSYFALVIPGIGWCGILASSIGKFYTFFTSHKVSESVFAFRTGSWVTAVFVTTLATNITATFLLAYRLWRVNRHIEGLGRSSRLRVVYQVVIESAAIYTAFTFTTLLLFLAHDRMVYVIRDLIPPIISISFNLIVVRVAFATSRKLTALGVEGSKVISKSAVRFGDSISQGSASSSAGGVAISMGSSPAHPDAKHEKSITVELTQLAEPDGDRLPRDDDENMVNVVGIRVPSRGASDASGHLA